MNEPTTQIGAKPPCYRDDALAVLKALRAAGHVAYFAGGCVRDELLGLTPKDFDVATDAPPNRVRELFRNTQAVGAAFGVILVRHGKSVVEVATFRSDGAYLDGRRPSEVRFTNAEEDAKRRDFTINGLFLDPIENRVIDYVGGQEDLKHRTLRAIGDPNARFDEDHLRLLRAIRFATRFELAIDPATRSAIQLHAPQLVQISPERIADELRHVLTHSSRARGWAMLSEFGFDEMIFRSFRLQWKPPLPEIQRGREPGFFERVARGRTITSGQAFALAGLEFIVARIPDLTKWREYGEKVLFRSLIGAMRYSLRLSNEELDVAYDTLLGFHWLMSTDVATVAQYKRFLARPTSAFSREIVSALPAEIARDAGREVKELKLAELETTDYAPTPLISGDDLVAAGLPPGKLFKRILDEVYDAQLESRVTSKEQAMEMALALGIAKQT